MSLQSTIFGLSTHVKICLLHKVSASQKQESSRTYPLEQISHHLDQMRGLKRGSGVIDEDDQIHVWDERLIWYAQKKLADLNFAGQTSCSYCRSLEDEHLAR